VDRAYGLIRKWTATHAAAHDGTRLEDVLDRSNTACDVWADTAYRSAQNEEMIARRGFVSRIHRKKPKGREMPERARISNARKSRVRSAVEHVFAHQKGLMGSVVRTIRIARAREEISMANLAYNMHRLVWLRAKYATACAVGSPGRCLPLHCAAKMLVKRSSDASEALLTANAPHKTASWRRPSRKTNHLPHHDERKDCHLNHV
jgi:IS5 family transposase